ncbi:MAG: hypothetical protein H6625_09880 [Bdellovibrionaceae bacterium]|nr:hypothetical protein [Pseudobdellovibrionaceae bacterium]
MRFFAFIFSVLFSIACIAANSDSVSIFKKSKDGTLYLVDSSEDLSESIGKKFTLITDSGVTCGELNKGKSKDTLADYACKKDFTSSMVFAPEKNISAELPIGLVVKGCSKSSYNSKAIKWGSREAKEIVSKFPNKSYIGGEIKVFQAGKKRYILFIGVFRKGTELEGQETGIKNFEGKYWKDVHFFEEGDGKSIVGNLNFECCDSQKDPFCRHKEPAIRNCTSMFFDNKFSGVLLASNGDVEPYAIGYGQEGLHVNLWKLRGSQPEKIYHNSVYAVGGCE